MPLRKSEANLKYIFVADLKTCLISMDFLAKLSEIKLTDYDYLLPDHRIAKFPLEKRDASKLLHYKNGQISHHSFSELPDLIPSGTLMVFNNTKVIPARLIFTRSTGAKVEIFLLKPVAPSTVINEIMLNTASVSWETMIGNLKKWKDGEVLQGEVQVQGQAVLLNARLLDRESKTVEFFWDGNQVPFVSIVDAAGEVPLPPYLNRKATEMDKPRYQTVYSAKEGAVAAPTAGLHFTDEVLERLKAKNVAEAFLTLHVGAGTFQPVKEVHVVNHMMHSEQMVVDKATISKILSQNGPIVAVGTTSMRTLESLFWFGVQLLQDEVNQFNIPKLYPYQERDTVPSRKESMQAILDWMEAKGIAEVTGATEIFLMPGYQFRVCDGLVTNFHQPASTLILLVAAYTNGHWRKIYDVALEQDYRFLSYGDSSLLWYGAGA
jgi:S-adenosylmethionine:tRNA ribosyltransferase-isomerase